MTGNGMELEMPSVAAAAADVEDDPNDNDGAALCDWNKANVKRLGSDAESDDCLAGFWSPTYFASTPTTLTEFLKPLGTAMPAATTNFFPATLFTPIGALPANTTHNSIIATDEESTPRGTCLRHHPRFSSIFQDAAEENDDCDHDGSSSERIVFFSPETQNDNTKFELVTPAHVTAPPSLERLHWYAKDTVRGEDVECESATNNTNSAHSIQSEKRILNWLEGVCGCCDDL